MGFLVLLGCWTGFETTSSTGTLARDELEMRVVDPVFEVRAGAVIGGRTSLAQLLITPPDALSKVLKGKL
jgi:hypothetical protein